MSNYAMKASELWSASRSFLNVRDAVDAMALDECDGRIESGSDDVNAALKDLVDDFDSRRLWTSERIEDISDALRATEKASERNEDKQGSRFKRITAHM